MTTTQDTWAQVEASLQDSRRVINGLCARTPVRDVTETLSGIDAALAAIAKERETKCVDVSDWQPVRDALNFAYGELGLKMIEEPNGKSYPSRDWNITAKAIEHYNAAKEICWTCKKPLTYRTVIRCLDCKTALCERCAEAHFGEHFKRIAALESQLVHSGITLGTVDEVQTLHAEIALKDLRIGVLESQLSAVRVNDARYLKLCSMIDVEGLPKTFTIEYRIGDLGEYKDVGQPIMDGLELTEILDAAIAQDTLQG